MRLQEIQRLNRQLEERNQQLQRLARDLRHTGESEHLAREALRESEQRLQAILDNCPAVVYLKDPDGRYLLVNQYFETLFHCPRQEVLGRSDQDLFPKEWADAFQINDRKVLDAKKPLEFEEVAPQDDGLHTYISIKFPLVNSDGAVHAVCGISTDISERKRAEEALRAGEERIRLLLESSGEGIYGIDMQGRCTFLNRVGAEMIGCLPQEALGENMHDFTHHHHPNGAIYPVSECPIYRTFRTGQDCRVDTEVFWRRNGTAFPVEYSSHPIRTDGKIHGAVIAFTDITDRKEAEEKLRVQNRLLQEMAHSEREANLALKQAQSQMVQAEKLVALGQLVAGVAHEINNPLSYVINNVAVLQRDVRSFRDLLALYHDAEVVVAKSLPELHSRIRELAEQMDLKYTLENLEGLMDRSRDGLKRIQHIVKDLRDFARLDESDLQEVDLNAGIESTINIVQGQAKKQQVVLELDLQSLPGVTCYPAKINQVVLNLVANAIDACSAGGKVTVGTRRNGDAAEILVADTGAGIDPAIREKIFDPFFTTKPQGKGTGLGLSISYGIIKAHGGKIDFESTPGKGTCFHIHLPRKYAGNGENN